MKRVLILCGYTFHIASESPSYVHKFVFTSGTSYSYLLVHSMTYHGLLHYLYVFKGDIKCKMLFESQGSHFLCTIQKYIYTLDFDQVYYVCYFRDSWWLGGL